MTAKELADQATELASRLKPGTWEAVQALALASIAQSLASVAACPREKQPGKGRSNRMLEQHCAVPFPFDGKITLRHGRPLCSIGLYRCLAGRTVHSLVDNLDTTVIDAVTGEVPPPAHPRHRTTTPRVSRSRTPLQAAKIRGYASRTEVSSS